MSINKKVVNLEKELVKVRKQKALVSLLTCEIFAISLALLIDTIVFFDGFTDIVIPIVLIVLFSVIAAASLVIGLVLSSKLSHNEHRILNGYYDEVKAGEVLLKVENLSQHFGRLKAVDNVSFDIKKGEVFGLVGESGCGKTTTGRTIIKLYPATGGDVYFKGQRICAGTLTYKTAIAEARAKAAAEITDLNLEIKAKPETKEANKATIKRIKAELKAVIDDNRAKIKAAKRDSKHYDRDLVTQIQMIFQDPSASLDPRLTVREIISEGLIIKGEKDKEAINKKVDEMLELVGLVREHAGRYQHEFSGGQRQRIGVARAVIMNPELIIADEPVSALDVSVQAQVINLLNDLRRDLGLTILFIAHDLSVVKYFSDRIGVMYFGQMVELADSDELFAHPIHPYTKSLLSAIPLPDPRTEKTRQRIKYNPLESHDYSAEGPIMREIVPGHFVLCNTEEYNRYILEYQEEK